MAGRQFKLMAVLVPALALALWCASALFAQQLALHAGGPVIRWQAGEGMSPAELSRVQRYAREDGGENTPAATLWQEHTDQTAMRTDGGGGASVHVVQVYGQVEQAFPLGFAHGAWPIQGDLEGCAVDELTASTLWGSTAVIGKQLDWEGKTYTVRGVFRGAQGLMVVQDAADSGQKYATLALSFPEGGGRQLAEDFLKQASVGAGAILDLEVLSYLASLLSVLPGLLLALGLLLRLARRAWMLRHTPVLLGVYAVPALLGGATALWAAAVPWAVPGRLIPTRWADFTFWPGLASALGGEYLAFLSSGLDTWSQEVWSMALMCLLCSLLATAATALGFERVRVKTGLGLVAGCLASLLWLYVLAVGLVPAGGVLLSRSMYLLPLMWLVVDWCLSRHSRALQPTGEGGRSDDTQALMAEGQAGTGGNAGPSA